MKSINMRLIITILFSFFSLFTFAQVPKKTIVEHFTNTSCSVCANNNPGILATLQSNPSVLHISFHPSSPYSNCFFSMQNPIENDARTNFYGIFGGTPKLILNGVLTTTANLSNAINAASTDSSNFEIKTYQKYITADSVEVKVTVKKVANDTLTNALLFVGCLEDTIMQTTNNGESVHHDVFRKALTNVVGNIVTLPTTVNDSITQTFNYKIQANWAANRMNSISILQHSVSKKVINSSLSENVPNTPTLIDDKNFELGTVYPNPATDFLYIDTDFIGGEASIWTLEGRKVLTEKIRSNIMNTSSLASGSYILLLTKNNKTQYGKFIINKH